MFAKTTSSYYDLMDYGTKTSSAAEAGIWIIIAAILAVIGGVLVYFLFVNKKETPKGKFLIWLKDFLSFKTMWVETLIKVFYYITTIFVILASFAIISTSFLSFILTLILGPVLTRLVYEGMLMFIMIWRNTKDISEHTKK